MWSGTSVSQPTARREGREDLSLSLSLSPPVTTLNPRLCNHRVCGTAWDCDSKRTNNNGELCKRYKCNSLSFINASIHVENKVYFFLNLSHHLHTSHNENRQATYTVCLLNLIYQCHHTASSKVGCTFLLISVVTL